MDRLTDFDVVVVGAGAAGMMAALFAATVDGVRVAILEGTADGGRKILISGGGRCNVLPSQLEASQYFTSSSPHTLKKMLLSWPLREQIRFFESDLEVPLSLEEESGKLFPASNRARDVRDALTAALDARGVRRIHGVRAQSLSFDSERWRIGISGPREGAADEIRSGNVILATGGLSVPQTGSDGTGLRMVERLGHSLTPTYPALTPLLSSPPVHADLAGISLHVRLTAAGAAGGRFQTEGGFLFTHRGYSGPSVLNVSHFASTNPGQVIQVAWRAMDEDAWASTLAAEPGRRVSTHLRELLPERLALRLLGEAQVDETRVVGQLRREERLRLLETLGRYTLPWTGDEGYRKAEVTGGGVVLGEVNPGTMESRLKSGLFLCGEILDAFGPIGGYNFAWAWATGRAAGRGAAARVQSLAGA